MALGMAIGAGISAIGGLAQTFSGIFGKGKRDREIDKLIDSRPQYEIPDEAVQMLGSAQARANARLDEQQDFKQSLFTQRSNQLSNAAAASGDINKLLALGASSDANMTDALIKNRISGAQERNLRFQRLDNALANMSEYRDQEFKLNELDPFNMRTQMKQQNAQMSRDMTFGGLNQMASSFMDASAIGIESGLEDTDGFVGKLFGKRT